MSSTNHHLLRRIRFHLAHDLRNPLSAAWTTAAFMSELEDVDDSLASKSLRTIRSALDRALSRVDDLSTLIELETEALQPTMEDVRVTDLLTDVRNSVDAGRTDASTVRWPPRSRLAIHCDRELAARCVSELVQNALQHGSSEHGVDVGVSRGDMSVVVEVADRGPGVREAQRDSLFAPLSAREASPPRRPGVGLPLCRAVADLHGASLGYEPRSGGGARFWIEFEEA